MHRRLSALQVSTCNAMLSGIVQFWFAAVAGHFMCSFLQLLTHESPKLVDTRRLYTRLSD